MRPLSHGYHFMASLPPSSFPTVSASSLWCEPLTPAPSSSSSSSSSPSSSSSSSPTVENVFGHGTLSIRFIGLNEAFQILTGKQFFDDETVYQNTLAFVTHMRTFTDTLHKKHTLNFSLLATSGEMISGRFPTLNSQLYAPRPVLEKEFYTNAFHVAVDSGMVGP